MSEAVAPPFIVASLLLCVAGVLKLRSPAGAAAALDTRPWVIRSLAAGEVALGTLCVLHPTRAPAAALALTYMTFAAVAVVLMRRRVACGCFGESDFPVSLAHVIASELLGTLALAAAIAGPRGLGWVFEQPAPTAFALLVGIAGAVYATVLVYTVAPRAFAAWSAE
jgi:hypothetical protein